MELYGMKKTTQELNDAKAELKALDEALEAEKVLRIVAKKKAGDVEKALEATLARAKRVEKVAVDHNVELANAFK